MEQMFPEITVTWKTGNEPFTHLGSPLGYTLLGFWQWIGSDLTSNTMRGMLAEFIVAQALNAASGPRREWDAQDLVSPEGTKIEVKSAAYCQTWKQERESKIIFGIRPTHGWDAVTNDYSIERKRQADVYVFCVLKHRDQSTLDPLSLEQWEFYVLSTRVLNALVPNQKTISLSSLLHLGAEPTSYDSLRKTVAKAATI